MPGWTKEKPTKMKRHYRAVVSMAKEGDGRSEDRSTFVYVYEVNGEQKVRSLGYDKESIDTERIKWWWSEPEPEYSAPFESKYNGLDDLDTVIDTVRGSIEKGDLGYLWNAVGREFKGKKEETFHHLQIVSIDPMTGVVELVEKIAPRKIYGMDLEMKTKMVKAVG